MANNESLGCQMEDGIESPVVENNHASSTSVNGDDTNIHRNANDENIGFQVDNNATLMNDKISSVGENDRPPTNSMDEENYSKSSNDESNFSGQNETISVDENDTNSMDEENNSISTNDESNFSGQNETISVDEVSDSFEKQNDPYSEYNKSDRSSDCSDSEIQRRSTDSTCDENEQIHESNGEGTNMKSSPEDGRSKVQKLKIIVEGCNHTSKKFVFDKKDVCLYCKKYLLNTSFIRHMNQIHSGEKEVIQINSHRKGSVEKNRSIQVLRNLGNFRHNKGVMETGGQLIVVQRPRKPIDITRNRNQYSACSNCFGFYSSLQLRRHNCPAAPRKSKSRSKVGMSIDFAEDELHMFFSRMLNDKITDLARKDELIKRFVYNEVLRKGMKKFKVISEKVRALCNFLVTFQSKTGEMVGFKEILVPDKLDKLKDVIVTLFDYNVQSNDSSTSVSMSRPSSLKRLGECLIQLTTTLRLEYLKQSLISQAMETKNLIDLLEAEVRPLMTNANLSLASASHGLPKPLPTNNQIQKLKDYISNFLSTTALTNENRRSIIETVLSYIILFNKRRSGEASNLTKENWNDRSKWKKFASDESTKITTEEKKLLESLELVYLKGKCNKFVPILFPRDCVHVVQWLSERTKKFIFENNRGNPIRGNDAMREVVRRAGVPCDNINSTNFRKLAATTLQVGSLIDKAASLL